MRLYLHVWAFVCVFKAVVTESQWIYFWVCVCVWAAIWDGTSSLSLQGPEQRRGNGCNDTQLCNLWGWYVCFSACLCVCVFLVLGTTTIVSASGSAERKLFWGGGRVRVRPIHRLRQHGDHRRVPGAVCARCVCACVWGRQRHTSLVYLLLPLFLSWTFLCAR